MKKIVDSLILIVLCIFLFTGCQEQIETINFEEIANASKIQVTHYFNGIQSSQIIKNTDDITDVANWFNTLILDEVNFAENTEPTEQESKEYYSFTIEENEQNNISVDYIIDDEQNGYILYNEKWYTVKNSIVPTFID